MKLNKAGKVIFTSFLSTIMLASTVLADITYIVKGNSMNPTLKNGDIIKNVGTEYENGDLVVARVKQTNEIIVKRLIGNKLIGDNKGKTINFKLDEVEILGKAEKEDDSNLLQNIDKMNITEQAKALGVDSPIKRVYAGAEYVLFLHENTAITGYGSNVGNVLGVSGGTNKNSAELVLVSELTGFSHLKARAGYAFGFRPVEGKEGIYNVFNINTGIKNFSAKPVSAEIRDYDNASRTGFYNNPHDASWYVDSTGKAFGVGSDYAGIGVGSKFPFKHYPSSWVPLIKGDFTEPIISNPTDGWLVQNEDNSATDVIITTNEFTTISENFAIDFNYRDILGQWGDTYVKIEILDSNSNVIQTITNPYSLGSYSGVNTYTAILNKPIGNYKMRITSRNTKCDVRVRDRQNFNNVKQIVATLDRTITTVNENNEIFFHSPGWGVSKKVTFNDGTGVPVQIKNETIVGSYSSNFGAIDTLGRIWTWSGTTASLVSMPNVDGKPFYDTRIITEFAIGAGNYIAKSETKDTDKVTEAWLWGSNNYGKLGDGTTTTNSIPTRYKVLGNILTNIQSVSVGQHFTVIVQNTPDGQLVWSSGRNNSGQLGGGLQLAVTEPLQMPGIANAKKVIAENASEILVLTSDDKIYATGGSKSYPTEENMSRVNAVLANKMVENWVYANHGYWRESIFSQPTAESIILTKYDRKAYGYGYSGYSSTSINGKGFTPITVDVNWQDSFGRTSADRTFSNVKAVAAVNMSGALIDDQGRLWGWGYGGSMGVGKYKNSDYDTNGNPRHVNYAQPMHLLDGSHAPNIFVDIVGNGSSGYALTDQGKLWYINSSGVTPISSNYAINNVKVTKIFPSYIGSGAAAIDENGEIWTWNAGGTPVKIPKDKYNNEKVIDVSIGENHTLFATEQGSVWAFGDNSYGKLGNGNETNVSSTSPAKVLNLQEAVSVTAALDSSYAIDKQGRVWSWGYSGVGALGNNFSLDRSQPSTSLGNDLPEVVVTNNLGKHYFGKNKRKVVIEGTSVEPESESVTISTTMLGSYKSIVLGNKEEVTVDNKNYAPNPWELDVYDQVTPKNWNLEWDISDFDQTLSLQPLTTVTIVDKRGGLMQTNYSGHIIIDNEDPSVPNWGETCFLNVDTRAETSCSTEPVFIAGGKNGVNQPVRIYLNIMQKTGLNKAPVRAQISYRKKTTAGFYLNDWSEWTEATKDSNGKFYYDFYEGFLGETQIKVRGIDEANNITEPNNSSRYVIINNAGGEIKSANAKAFSDENYALYNQLTFLGSTPSGSTIQSYNVDRRDKLEASKNPVDADGNPINHWINLTPTRVVWDGTETIFTDTNLVKQLKGNTVYEYRVDAKNNIAVGQYKITEVTTNPYVPENLEKAPNNEGMVLSISQDKRNQNSILYRLVITDNMTGNVFTKDYTSNNVNEDIVFDLKSDDVFAKSGVKIVNNSIKIQVLVQGTNKQWVDVIYDENFINSPAISTDTQKPDVMFMIPELYKTIVKGKYGFDNKIQLSLFATDNVSPRHKLQVQFSLDGTNWIGLKQVSPTQKEWIANHWSGYQDIYGNFAVGENSGKKLIYVRVQDEAGNVTYANAEMIVIDPLNRTNPDSGTSTPINDPTNGTVITDFTNTTERHIKSPNTKIMVPKDGNLTEVQFSFNGIEWSPWEKIGDNGLTKFVTLPYGNGNRTVMVRYKNDSGLVTDLESNSDIITYVLDEEKPTGEIKTRNGTLLSTKFAVPLKFFTEDNLSSQVKVTVVGQNENGQPFTLNKVYINAQGELEVNTNADGFINGNKVVLDTGTTNFYGVVGLVPNKFNEIRFKLEDKAGNTSYKTIRIFYKG